MERLVFWCLAGTTLVSALAVVTLRNVLHSALFLGLALAGVAGLFASLGADFLFAAQLLVYVTGVAVLVLFVVMLSGRASELHLRQINDHWIGSLLICGGILWGLWGTVSLFRGVRAEGAVRPTTAELGRLFLSDFALPFELISIILIVALVGAVLFTRPEEEA